MDELLKNRGVSTNEAANLALLRHLRFCSFILLSTALLITP
ncbi:MAG: hypothetical protein WKF89_10580 [Chitinophagaceae bacterium]